MKIATKRCRMCGRYECACRAELDPWAAYADAPMSERDVAAFGEVSCASCGYHVCACDNLIRPVGQVVVPVANVPPPPPPRTCDWCGESLAEGAHEACQALARARRSLRADMEAMYERHRELTREVVAGVTAGPRFPPGPKAWWSSPFAVDGNGERTYLQLGIQARCQLYAVIVPKAVVVEAIQCGCMVHALGVSGEVVNGFDLRDYFEDPYECGHAFVLSMRNETNARIVGSVQLLVGIR